MKRIIINLVAFLFSIALFCGVYIVVFKASPLTLGILWVVLILYGFCMGLSWKGTEKIKIYEQRAVHFGLSKEDEPKILLFSLMTLAPSYLCIILVSLIPIISYEVWFMTVFPCIFFNILPASTVLGEYYGLTHKKLPFVLILTFITTVSCIVGVVLSRLLFKT